MESAYWLLPSTSYIYHNDLSNSEGKRFDKESKVEILFSKDITNINRWDRDTEFKLFKTEDGDLGYSYSIPNGYSSYTYEPDVNVHVYKTSDMQWFKNFALDQELRDILDNAL